MANPKVVVEVGTIGTSKTTKEILNLTARVKELRRAEKGLGDESKKVQSALKPVNKTIRDIGKSAKKTQKETSEFAQTFTASMRVLEGPLGGVAGRMQSLLVLLRTVKLSSVLLVGSITALTVGVVALGGAVFKTVLRLDALDSQFLAATGSAAKSAQALSFVKDIADELGLKFLETASQFAIFTASMKGTGLEGEQIRRIFRSISVATTALNLDTVKTGRIFTAFQQIASKGKVSMEEISGQLGESLPGAMDIARRAMGLTKIAFIELVSSGKLLSEDLLPNMADVLINDFAGASAEASTKLRSELNRLTNAFEETLTILVEETEAGNTFSSVVRGMTNTTNLFNTSLRSSLELLRILRRSLGNLPKPGPSVMVDPGDILPVRIGVDPRDFLPAPPAGLPVQRPEIPKRPRPFALPVDKPAAPFSRPTTFGATALIGIIKEQNKLRKEANDIILEGLPLRGKLAEEESRLILLKERGVLTEAQFTDAISNLNKQLLESNPLVQSLSATFDNFADSMIDAALAGENAFQSLKVAVGTALREIAKELLKFAIISPLKKFITGAALNIITGGISAGAGAGIGAPTSLIPAGGIGSGGVQLSAKGNAFSGGVRALQKGGLINSPTLFGSREGLNLAGEAGTEAVLPLQRDSQGRLGVSADISGGGRQGDTFVIDARGADPGQLQNLMALIRQLNGSIEERAISASTEDAARRPLATGTL